MQVTSSTAEGQTVADSRAKSDEDLLKLVADSVSPLAVVLHNIDGPSELLHVAQLSTNYCLY